MDRAALLRHYSHFPEVIFERTLTLVDMSIFLLPQEGAPLALPAISAMEIKILQSQGIHALIGQDVLARCVLVHDGPQQRFTLSWEG